MVLSLYWLCWPDKRNYFIIVDSFSKWPEVVTCKAQTSKNTINMLHELCARFRLPETIVSDNATQFSSKGFGNFCKMFSRNHLKSAPYHPRWNGLVERFINEFKRVIKKANEMEKENEELQKFLSIYWIMLNVNASSGKAPAELIFARKICSVFDELIPSKNKIKESKSTRIIKYVSWLFSYWHFYW